TRAMRVSPRADLGPFLASSSAGLFASSLPSQQNRRVSRLRTSNPGIISAGASCGDSYSSGRKRAANSGAFAKSHPPTWLLLKLACSSKVCRSAEKNELKPWLKQRWCIPPHANGQFVWHMEDVLEVYTRPHNARFPQVCVDESGKQLVAEK